MIKAWRRWRRLAPAVRANITLVAVVGVFLLGVVIADRMGLTNHA